MGTRDPRFDAYIENAAPFARPILSHLREVVHAACPEVVEEMKWSSPHFTYRGMLAQMAAFKQHCAFGFWKGALIVGDDERARQAMGSFGRIASLDDLPPDDVLAEYVHRAMRLNEQGVTAPPRPPKHPKPELGVPDDLAAAFQANDAARAAFDGFTPGQKREYLEWITEARSGATRQKRLAQAVEWMTEGKTRNWKYQRK